MNRDVLHVKKTVKKEKVLDNIVHLYGSFFFSKRDMVLVYKSRTCYQIPPSWTLFLWKKKKTFSSSKLKQACCVVCVSSQPFYWIISSRQLLMPVYIKRLYSPASVIITRGCWSGSRSSMRKSSPKSGSLVPSTVSDAGNLYRKIYLCCSIFDYFSSVFIVLWFTLSKTKH